MTCRMGRRGQRGRYCWSGRRGLLPGRISSDGARRGPLIWRTRSTHGRARSSVMSHASSARGPSHRRTSHTCRSSNGQCGPRGSGHRRSASFCTLTTASGTPIAVRCCSMSTSESGKFADRVTFAIYVSENPALNLVRHRPIRLWGSPTRRASAMSGGQPAMLAETAAALIATPVQLEQAIDTRRQCRPFT